MKPPPRARSRPQRVALQAEAGEPSGSSRWRQAEQKQLLAGLKALSAATKGQRDPDWKFLQERVPSRSTAEICSMVQVLKQQVFSAAQSQLKKAMVEERRKRRPVEEWSDLAARLSGSLEDAVSSAFSQMLIVSSTEPRTMKNCDPPLIFKPASRTADAARRAPGRPSVPASSPAATSSQPVLLKAPTLTRGPSQKLPPQSQILLVTNPCGAWTSSVASPRPVSSAAARPAPSSGSVTGAAATTQQEVTFPSPQPRPPSTSSTATSGGPLPVTAAFTSDRPQTGRGQPHKDAPTPPHSKDAVDFEKIYCFLSETPRPSQKHQLTPMESAVVLDLLMSLPEELPLLDLNKLRTHLLQVHQCFSAPAHPKKARLMVAELVAGLGAQEPETPSRSEQEPSQLPAQEPQSQSAASHASSSQSEDSDWIAVPPMNPFMVPLTLLQRKKTQQ